VWFVQGGFSEDIMCGLWTGSSSQIFFTLRLTFQNEALRNGHLVVGLD